MVLLFGPNLSTDLPIQSILDSIQTAQDFLGDIASAIGQAATWVWDQIQSVFNAESSDPGLTSAQQAISQDTDNGTNTSTNAGGYAALGTSSGIIGSGGYAGNGSYGSYGSYGGYTPGEPHFDSVKTKKTANAASVNRASVGTATAHSQLAALHLSQATATATHPGSYSAAPVARQAEPELHLAAHH